MSSVGLGGGVVQGAVNPDEFYAHKPTLKCAVARPSLEDISAATDQDGLCGNPIPPRQTVDTSNEERNSFSER